MHGNTEPERDITEEIDKIGVTGIHSSEPQPAMPRFSLRTMLMVVKPDGTSTAPARFKGDDDSSSIMIVEIAHSDIHWMEPRDLSLEAMSFRINDPSKPSISSYHVGGAFVVKTNGEVEFLDEAMTEEQLRKRLGAGP